MGGWSADSPVFIAKRLLSAAKVAVHVRQTTAFALQRGFVRLQNEYNCSVKGVVLQSKRSPFRGQKESFCIADVFIMKPQSV